MDDWRFTAAVSIDRVARLGEWPTFDAIVSALAQAPVERFWWEPYRSPRLLGCNRASFTLRVAPPVYDAFFNSSKGYRAQYALSPTAGEIANCTVLNALEFSLMNAAALVGAIAPALVRASLRAVDAKMWIDEAEVDHQLSDPSPALNYTPWEFNSPDGQGLRAPLGTLLEVKGGWLDPDGNEKRDPLKAGRSLHIHKAGFS